MRTSASVPSPRPSTVILSLAVAALLSSAALRAAAGPAHQTFSEPASAEAVPGEPAATLAPDALDAPAPTAVEEAARSARLAAQMATGGHGMMHGPATHYRQIDAGRVVPPSAGPKPSPSPSPSSHEHHP